MNKKKLHLKKRNNYFTNSLLYYRIFTKNTIISIFHFNNFKTNKFVILQNILKGYGIFIKIIRNKEFYQFFSDTKYTHISKLLKSYTIIFLNLQVFTHIHIINKLLDNNFVLTNKKVSIPLLIYLSTIYKNTIYNNIDIQILNKNYNKNKLFFSKTYKMIPLIATQKYILQLLYLFLYKNSISKLKIYIH